MYGDNAPGLWRCQYSGVWWIAAAGRKMADQLSAGDWVKQGLRALAKEGFTALKAEPLAKTMGVSRGSFYWHFADVGAFHAEILKAWREIAAERIIADVDAAAAKDDALQLLLRRVFGERLALENAVRRWAVVDGTARAAVEAIDKRRQDYIESLLRSRGLSPEIARARTQILYWSYLGFALSDRPLPSAQQRAVLTEMLRIASL
jgi:AcrR family transcriptional regulator